MDTVFLVGSAVMVVGFLVMLFLPHVELRKGSSYDDRAKTERMRRGGRRPDGRPALIAVDSGEHAVRPPGRAACSATLAAASRVGRVVRSGSVRVAPASGSWFAVKLVVTPTTTPPGPGGRAHAVGGVLAGERVAGATPSRSQASA